MTLLKEAAVGVPHDLFRHFRQVICCILKLRHMIHYYLYSKDNFNGDCFAKSIANYLYAQRMLHGECLICAFTNLRKPLVYRLFTAHSTILLGSHLVRSVRFRLEMMIDDEIIETRI